MQRPGFAGPRRVRRLLTIGHSYCVAVNRRLAHEMAREGGRDWEVTAVAPEFFHGDLRPIHTERAPGELCRLETVPAFFSKRIQFFFYGRKLREILSRGWDVVHVWEEPYIVVGGQVAWWTPRQTPLVFWTGQNIVKRYPPPFARIERYCVDRCAGWVARGQTGLDALLAKGYGRRPHRAVPLGVDTDRFRPDSDARELILGLLGWSADGPPVVGYLGRFVEEKGLRILTATLDQLDTQWRALLVGGGPLEVELRKWAEPYGDRVRIVNGVDHDAVPAYLNAMDLLCAPSQTRSNWREIFGRMLIEAFACGVPVVASDSGEIPYVVRDAGMIVPEADVAGWARALANLINNPDARRDLSTRGLERAGAVYSWPAVARQHLDFLDQVLQSRATQAATS